MSVDQAVIRQLSETRDNLKARRLLPHAEAIERGLSALAALDEARAKAVEIASAFPGLRAEVENLKRQVAHLQGEVSKAQDEAKRAAVPRLEALAEARAEIRNVIRPFLTGDPGARMLALTIWHEMNARWGKEVS